MKVSAVIVTRGNVDLRPILDSLPRQWEKVVWNNSGGPDGTTATVSRTLSNGKLATFKDTGADLGVYGRYAAIAYAKHPVIYVQDDDCIVSDPAAIVDAWLESEAINQAEHSEAPLNFVVCNQPEPWRSNPFYADHALVGFGAAFHRDVPNIAFGKLFGEQRWQQFLPGTLDGDGGQFMRTCDIVVTALTPRVLIEVPHESFAYAWGDDRMWKQPTHQEERDRMLALVKEIA